MHMYMYIQIYTYIEIDSKIWGQVSGLAFLNHGVKSSGFRGIPV